MNSTCLRRFFNERTKRLVAMIAKKDTVLHANASYKFSDIILQGKCCFTILNNSLRHIAYNTENINDRKCLHSFWSTLYIAGPR